MVILFKKVVACLSLCLAVFSTTVYANDELYLGGDSIGIKIQYDGILVIGTYSFSINGETYQPTKTIQSADVIVEINNQKVTTLQELYQQLSLYQEEVNDIPVTIRRNDKTIESSLKTTYDTSSNTFKSGLYVKDSIIGVGTLTYYDPYNQMYGALGHEIMDTDVKKIANVSDGSLYTSNVVSITKAEKHNPGEKHAEINFSNSFANILTNTNIGIYGKYHQLLTEIKKFPWANQNEVHTGKAVMYTVVKGNVIEPFAIEITKTHSQNQAEPKGIEFVIADDSLSSISNGIVQGMSGSPIVQDGKIIGAVTHVVTSNPSKGYGVYIEWMLEKSRNLT